MAIRIGIVANEPERSLHGLQGAFSWGEARTFDPTEEEALAGFEADACVALGMVVSPVAVSVRWLAGPARELPGDPAERVVATEGATLWRRAPFAASDPLFELAPSPGALVVVAEGDAGARASAADKLRARGATVEVCEQLTLQALERAAVVALVGTAGGPLAARATAVLAAGRLLVAPEASPAFGLLAGVDHLAYAHEDELAEIADAAATFPGAFESIVAMGRLSAEAHRASVVYGRLAVDLRLTDA